MPTIEPTVTEEKLRQLLDEGHESDLLDFKDTCNLEETRDRVELAKDVGAMQVDGGYIVIGADEHGQPTARLTATCAALLDESIVRKKLGKYLPEPFEIRAATHRIGDDLVAVIYVGPNPNGMAVFRADGNYPGGGPAFRAGDVYVRHGTSSERWQQHDIARIHARAMEHLKESWRVESTESMRAGLEAGQRAQDLARAPAEALDWRLDAETFASTAVEQLRRNDDIPLHLALDRIEFDAGALYSTGFAQELGTLLDRLTCLAAVFVRTRRDDWLDEVLHRLLAVYEIPMRPGPIVQDRQAAMLWLSIAERAEALGGLAVRRRKWDAVRHLALVKTPTGQHHPYLFRHVVVQAGRAGLLAPTERKGVSLVSLARTVVDRLDCLRPDLPSTDDRILDSICQFDVLAALAAIADYGAVDTRVFYTSFAYYFSVRTEPIIELLLTDTRLRERIFPKSDDELATALVTLNHYATSEGFRFSGWDGFSNPKIVDFIRKHSSQSPSS